MRRRYWVTALAAMLMGVFLFPTAALAKPEFVDLCHYNEDTGDLKVISIPAKAADRHLANHDEDILVGEGVDGDCNPIDDPTGVLAGCYTNGVFSYDYDGTIDTLGNAPFIVGTDCTGDLISTRTWVQADDSAGAAALFAGLAHTNTGNVSCSNLLNAGYSVPADYWACFEFAG